MKLTTAFIEKFWPLTNVAVRKMPKQGMAGQVGIVEAKEGTFTYKIAGSWKTAKNLERDLSAYEFLNERKFKYISQILLTKEGKSFVNYEDSLIYLIKFIEGDHPDSTPGTYSILGKMTAELHSTKDFPFVSDYKPADAIPQLIGNAEKYCFKDEYIKILQSLPDFSRLTMAPIHTEITPGNVIQTPSGGMVIIDWDEVGTGPAVLDLGVSLVNHFISEDLEILDKNAKAYYQGYFSMRKMDSEEKKYIYDAAIFWACAWVSYGDLDKRWNRIKWAWNNREIIEKLISS